MRKINGSSNVLKLKGEEKSSFSKLSDIKFENISVRVQQ